MKQQIYQGIIGIVLILLTACSGLETETRYIPPTSDVGRMCASQCQSTKSMCDMNCRLERRLCDRDEREDDRLRYEYGRDNRYENAMDDYRQVEQGYRQCLQNTERSVWRRAGFANVTSYCQSRFDWEDQIPPRRPRGGIRRYANPFYTPNSWRCDEGDCGCQKAYESCYESCGGQVRHIQRCTYGCDR